MVSLSLSKGIRRLAWGLLPLASVLVLGACTTRSAPPPAAAAADEPYDGYAPIIIRRSTFNDTLPPRPPTPPAPPRTTPAATLTPATRLATLPPAPKAAAPAAAAAPVAAAPAAPAAAAVPKAAAVAAAPAVVAAPKPASPPKPAEPPELLALATAPLPVREVHTLAAMSDADVIGPIVEMQVPTGGPSGRHPVVNTRPVARPVACKAVRSRDAKDEKITVSCANSSAVTQRVAMTMEAVGLSGVPTPEEGKAGWTIGAGKTRQIAVLTTVGRPTRVEIFFTHEAQP